MVNLGAGFGGKGDGKSAQNFWPTFVGILSTGFAGTLTSTMYMGRGNVEET